MTIIKPKELKIALSLITILVILSMSLFYIKRPIRVGFLAPLSGADSNFGVAGRNGAALAIDTINSDRSFFDRPIELIIKDDHSSPDQALKKVKEFNSESINIIIANMTSNNVKNVISYANSNNMLIFSPSASSDEYSNINDNFIRIAISSSLIGKSLADIATTNNHSNITFIKDISNLSFTDIVERSFIEGFVNNGGSNVNLIELENDSFDDFDYSSLSNKIKLNNSSAVILATNDIKTRFILQSLSRDELDLPIYSTSWPITNYLLTKGGEGINGLYFADIIDFSDNVEDPRIIKYKDEYNDFFNEKPEMHSLRSYDATNIIYKLLNKKSSFSAKSLKRDLLNNHHDTVQGEFFINKYGDVEKKLILFEVYDGKYRKVKEQ